MIKYDKLKIVTSMDALISLQEDRWEIKTQGGVIVEESFVQRTPCLVMLRVKRTTGELLMEITGKILKDNYPQLITSKTIGKCLDAINALGACIIDEDYVLQNAYVTRCDVTVDVPLADFEQFKTSIETNIKQPFKWNVRHYDKNLTIEKNVKTPKVQRRMSIYDKEKELPKNTDFLRWVNNPEEIKNYFKGRKRFELSLTTCSSIKEELGIPTCRLKDVLSSTANPHVVFFTNLLKPSEKVTNTKKTMRMYDKESTLIRHDWQLRSVEILYKQHYGDKYRTSMLDDYRELLAEHNRAEMLEQIDFHALFADDESVISTNITPVDAKYWKKHTEVSSWELGNSDISKIGDYRFITDCPCTEPEHVC